MFETDKKLFCFPFWYKTAVSKVLISQSLFIRNEYISLCLCYAHISLCWSSFGHAIFYNIHPVLTQNQRSNLSLSKNRKPYLADSKLRQSLTYRLFIWDRRIQNVVGLNSFVSSYCSPYLVYQRVIRINCIKFSSVELA